MVAEEALCPLDDSRRPLDSSYAGKWHAVSGSLETGESPVERARTEVEEETGLSRSRLKLLVTGRPVLVDDAARSFKVHPFLFRLDDGGDDIRLNWENADAKWARPPFEDALSSLACVPLLDKTLRRVTLPLPVLAAVAELSDDRARGATHLAARALDALRAWAESPDATAGVASPDEAVSRLRDIGFALAAARPAMACVGNAVARAVAAVVVHDFGDTIDDVAANVRDAAARERGRLDAAAAAAVAHARALLFSVERDASSGAIDDTSNRGRVDVVVTLSSSSLVTRTLCEKNGSDKRHDRRRLKVVVSESRPLREGVDVAARFASEGGHDVTLVTDAALGSELLRMKKQSCGDSSSPISVIVLVGADAIDDGDVVNKVGTRMLALAAREAGVPFFLVSTSDKAWLRKRNTTWL